MCVRVGHPARPAGAARGVPQGAATVVTGDIAAGQAADARATDTGREPPGTGGTAAHRTRAGARRGSGVPVGQSWSSAMARSVTGMRKEPRSVASPVARSIE